MTYINREQLSGFRDPTAPERMAVMKGISKTHVKSLWPMMFCQYFFITIAVIFLMNLLVISADRSLVADVVYAIFAIVFAAAACLTTQSMKTEKMILKKISNGEFQVMECVAYEVSYSSYQMFTGTVKIIDAQGQYCENAFLVDKGIARMCAKDMDTKLLLVKCGEDFYDMLLCKDIHDLLWPRLIFQAASRTKH